MNRVMAARLGRLALLLGALGAGPPGRAEAPTCPPRPGLAAGGLVRLPVGLEPTCGPLYQTFRRTFDTARWTEMYLIPPDAGQARVSALLAALEQAGYRRTRAQVTPRREVYLFQRGSRAITVVVGFSGLLRYLGLVGQ